MIAAGLLWASLSLAFVGPPPPPPPPPVAGDDEPAEEEDEPEIEPEPEPEEPEPDTQGLTDEGMGPETPDDAVDYDQPQNLDDDGPEELPKRWWRNRYLTISGYVQPQYIYRVRKNARPRDQLEFGAGQTRTGIRFYGEPINHWLYDVHLVIGAQILRPITKVDTVDYDGNGTIDGVSTTSQPTPGLFIERLAVGYRPVEYHGRNADKIDNPRDIVILELKFGQLRIPWTAQNRASNSALMFPRRSVPNNVFLYGTDLGGLARLSLLDQTVDINVGVFNGTGVSPAQTNIRGALYAGRLDVNPLGGFPYAEGDLGRGPFRFGVGAGLLYYPNKIFDDAGNDTRTRARDLRASASFRMQVKGFYLQGEFLRRQRTDSLSSLPQIATGAYGQTSFFFPIYKHFGAAPVGRFGWTTLDQSFDPLVTYYGDAGAALYFGNDVRQNVLKVLLQYVGEVRVTQQEQAHGASLQVQLKW